ncbi:M50 family metallopeptidase [Sphingomonas psychrotolerans]|uniref:M50 family metallopeptidase n=1 Tax=Sphingomonas psychrotolerans TaxID=1327635 RepID=A0ABU3N1T7_9SPHN|nr:site-2 protease family protein [Sphingomonas psychrotolerans]MDT8758348.1 M50 family metallopeptidase [Sphingomonas psychrotolerans]
MRALATLIFLVTAFGVVGLLADYFRGDAALLLRLAIDLLLSFVAVLVHELGHAAAAWRLGADVHGIVVLPLELRLSPPRLRMRWRAGKADIGGYVSYSLDRIDARRKHMMIAAAGPVASMLLAGVAGLIGHLAGVTTLVGTLFGALALLSGGMGLANLVPFKGSDGRHLLQGFRVGRRTKVR